MKRIVAFVRPAMLDEVVFALHELRDLPGVSMSEVKGLGRGAGDFRGESPRAPLHTYPVSVRLEIVCPDHRTAEIMNTIQQSAHTGRDGDGKIFVTCVDEAIRIRTGERGEQAI